VELTRNVEPASSTSSFGCSPRQTAAGTRLRRPKNGLGNLAARNVDQLAAVVRNGLKRIQYRPALISGFLAQTGLTLEPEPP